MDCQVNLGGEGSCNLTSEELGLTMNFELDPTTSYEAHYYGTTFNGNYAKAPLVVQALMSLIRPVYC